MGHVLPGMSKVLQGGGKIGIPQIITVINAESETDKSQGGKEKMLGNKET